jgi:hypothetical protein
MTNQTIVQAMVATTTLLNRTSGRTHLTSRCEAIVGNGNKDVLGAMKPSANVENNRSIIICAPPLAKVTLAGRPSELREVVHRYPKQAFPDRSATARSLHPIRGLPDGNSCVETTAQSHLTLDWTGKIDANADARGDFGRTESFMEYTITAAFLLAVVAGSFAAVILGGYGIAHLIASAF